MLAPLLSTLLVQRLTLPALLSTPLPLRQALLWMPPALLSTPLPHRLLMPLLLRPTLLLPSNPEIPFWNGRGPLMRPPFFLTIAHATLSA